VRFALALLIACLSLCCGAGVSLADAQPPQGFALLFNGKDFAGWYGVPHFDPRKLAAMPEDERKAKLADWRKDTLAHWRVDNGEIVNDGHGPYLTTEKEFGDFELLLEYKTVPLADSGIYLRWNPQVQIWDWTKAGGKWNRGADKGSGGLFNNAQRAPGQEPLVLADRPFGEWNRFRIRQVGARTDVWLNDKLVVDHAIMENFWDRSKPHARRGPFQLQTHGGEIRWRNLLIREIAADEANRILRGGWGGAAPTSGRSGKPHGRSAPGTPHDGFTPIFNGKDLTGWRGDVASYEVVDGAIVCKPKMGGNLFTKDEYADFIARLEFKLPPGGNNGLAIRYPGQGQPHLTAMCELQVLDNEHPMYAKLDPRQYHGSAYGMIPAHRGFLRPTGEWNYQEVMVHGSRVRVELNGFVILDGDLATVREFKDGTPHPGKDRTTGYFGFAGHSDPVAFRHIEIKRLGPAATARAESWPQFRGHNSSGLATTAAPLPTKIGPDSQPVGRIANPSAKSPAASGGTKTGTKAPAGPAANLLWKTALPPGHSSPVVFADRVYVTGVREQSRGKETDRKLVTIALDQATGRIVWERVVPHQKLEQIHRIGSYAQPSPATDGQIVVSLFGSAGLVAYDRDGKELWKVPMGPFNNDFGAGTSPIIVGDRVIVVQDHDTDSFLVSLDKRTGKEVWRTDRAEFPRNYCSPVIWEVDGRKQVVVAATLRVVGYDFDTGKELWTVRGIARTVCMTPVVGADNHLYVASWAAGGDPGEPIDIPLWKDALARDANRNGTLEEAEVKPISPVYQRFSQFDRDKSGSVTEKEYVYFRGLFTTGQNSVIAIKPGGQDDITATHVAWQHRKTLPFCASPLHANGYVFTVKDGGICTSLNAQTGQALKTARLRGAGEYYASPVAGDNKVYLIDDAGRLTVISSYAEWTILHDADFQEEVYATPALVDGRIYLRTKGQLYCFGER
jgi:outer membrane protein assembly factor BamB